MRNLQTLTVRRMNLGQSNHSISDFDNCPFFANSGGGGGGVKRFTVTLEIIHQFS